MTRSDGPSESHDDAQVGVCSSCGAHLVRGDGMKPGEFTRDWHAVASASDPTEPEQCGPVVFLASPQDANAGSSDA